MKKYRYLCLIIILLFIMTGSPVAAWAGEPEEALPEDFYFAEQTEEAAPPEAYYEAPQPETYVDEQIADPAVQWEIYPAEALDGDSTAETYAEEAWEWGTSAGDETQDGQSRYQGWTDAYYNTTDPGDVWVYEDQTSDESYDDYYDDYYDYSYYDPYIGTADILEEEVVRDDSEYRELVDKILVAIITPEMTDEEKCQAVYDYVHGIPYVNVVYSRNWKENGYRMLYDRAGDCFGFYSASRLLLERLGYSVIELQNMNGFTHVWCLVSIDGGITWLHFDPTNWSWGNDGDICLLTDEEMVAYGMRHQVGYNQLSHDWDREQAARDIEACQEQLKHRVYMLSPDEESGRMVAIW